jgi:hypothetical protein
MSQPGNCKRKPRPLGRWAGLALLSSCLAAEPPSETRIQPGVRDDNGVLTHVVECAYQTGKTKIRVLLPSRVEKGRSYPVLYVLPVEAGDGRQYGDGLEETRRLGLHDKYGLICVAPTFAQLPWYADHPTDPGIRQESYLLKVVLPFVEKTYPAKASADGRLLLGFSKSGWGAWSLLLRHPDVFGRAAAWDAPLMQEKPDQFGMGPIFGTQENFARYQLTALLRQRAGDLRDRTRLVLPGAANFRRQHLALHALLQELKVPHAWRDGPARKHHWESGWVAEAVELLTARH